jgi:hypothetical protein
VAFTRYRVARWPVPDEGEKGRLRFLRSVWHRVAGGRCSIIDPVLKVGTISESVQAEALGDDGANSQHGVGQVVNQQQLVDLPLNGRHVTQLITGGSITVQSGFGQARSSANLTSSRNYPNEALVSVARGMLNGTSCLLDRGTHNDVFCNLNLPLPFPDGVQEFKAETECAPQALPVLSVRVA